MSNDKYLSFEIPSEMESLRADKAIALETHMSRSVIAELFKNRKVLLNGEVIKRSEKANPGDVIEFEMPEDKSHEVLGQNIPLDIIFEDEFIVIINKEQGMVVHPGAGNPDNTLVNALVHLYPEIKDVGQSHRPGIVHRLDAGTSGLLVAAKTNEAYEIFVDKFSRHDVSRDYIALVWGKFETSSGVIDAPIGRSTARATKMAVRDDGKVAVTHYKVDECYEQKDVTLLDVSLETGRTHQIRVHCAAINHPIVGDKTYGGYRQSLECPRPFLHAHTLKFEHPITSEKMEFTATLPADLQDVLKGLEEV